MHRPENNALIDELGRNFYMKLAVTQWVTALS
jgi:hypothetical protein